MILAFDVGNTETTVALFDAENIEAHWRITTNLPRTPDEFSMLIRSLLHSDSIEVQNVTGAAICSVVPPVTEILGAACHDIVGSDPVFVDARAKLPIRLEVDEPLTVGADRVANTLAASRIWKRDTIVVDLGTATTYDCITAQGAFVGGIIQPGVRTSAETLFRRTSQLAATELIPPKKVIGTRTDECIRSGVLYGSVDSIDGLVARVKAEWQVPDPIVIGTGGLAETLRPFCRSFDEVDPYLTLKGIRIGYELLTSG
ncbi:MAG TPA: type III pantothenate kinase [Gemmatimonadaceae bacterium]|jgi:type III pantothenate kinase|nr:type III pantothenate kinase [Gemmatimonadaceae bacterium]